MRLTLVALVGFLLGYGIAYMTLPSASARAASGDVTPTQAAIKATKQPEIKANNTRIEQAVTPKSEANIQTLPEEQAVNGDATDSQTDDAFLGSIKQGFYREAVELVLDWMPAAELVPLIASFSGVDEERLEQMEDPHTFGKALAALALEECDSPFAWAETAEILFAQDRRNHNNFESLDSISSSASGRIYAHFRLPADYSYADVLVRWCRARPLRNHLFGNYPINVHLDPNYVWFHSDIPAAGTYYVHIWSAEEKPNLLASGSYEVLE